MKNIGEKSQCECVWVSATPRYEFATAICIWHVKYAKVMVHMFDIVRQLTALRSQMEKYPKWKIIKLSRNRWISQSSTLRWHINMHI